MGELNEFSSRDLLIPTLIWEENFDGSCEFIFFC